ncbi:diguanylate cyclase domain-containing protein [Actinoalloteichus caeruleus]|uniref:diguanylate cyclase domain-containing protein n=1 Tax=Actinoalloteichus cyanogriseus TaxID=2893586 RepID=UPI003AABE7C4
MGAVGTAARRGTGTVWDELVAELPVGVLLEDERGDLIAANELAGALLGLSRERLLNGRRPAGWALRDDSGAPLPDTSALLTQLRRNPGTLTLPLVVRHRATPETRLIGTYHLVSHRGRPALLVLLRPVDSPGLGEDVGRDPLTGLPGRALLFDRLEQALARADVHGTLVTLVLLDVQQLALFNSRHGFQRGDELLHLIAMRLRTGMRRDHTVARYGSDEFAVIAEHPRGNGAPIALRAREVVSQPTRLGGARLRPRLRSCWVTGDGSASVLAMMAKAEELLRAEPHAWPVPHLAGRLELPEVESG